MPDTILAIKVDVDTDRGTRIGVPNLAALFAEFRLPATFLFSLGPDNTGRAIKRILRPGFFRKVQRTSVVSVYGIRTLLNGTLLPAPHIGRRNADVMRAVRDRGYEVGIHCYDHVRWQDDLEKMSAQEVQAEFIKAGQEFERIFGTPARTAGAAGWQANASSLAAYDAAGLLYASDARGIFPFYPRVNGIVYNALQIPSTLPTLDELMGRPEFPQEKLVDHYLSLLRSKTPNVLTVHAEIEGMGKLPWFREFLTRALAQGVRFIALGDLAQTLLKNPRSIPICDLIAGEIDGRSGTLALQRVNI
ncbi:MAG TPA: polysaccharide deacetylase family protein [Acidiferrobacterales bacterium]|nr:polysaccharide deacetylase family protein [Acidiferrobacterales bacterium]